MTSVGKMADAAGSNPTSGTYRYYPHNHLGSSRDPLGMVDGPNMYAYVRNSPIRYYDEKGASISVFIVVALALWSYYSCLKAIRDGLSAGCSEFDLRQNGTSGRMTIIAAELEEQDRRRAWELIKYHLGGRNKRVF